MTKFHTIALAGLLAAISGPALAEIVNVTNSVTAENKEKGIAAVKERLVAACKERGGKADPASYETVFERTAPNPDVTKPYYVDGKMKCDLPS